MTLPIETERLLLRGFTLDDIDDMIELVSHPSVARVSSEIEASVAGVEKYINMQYSLQPFELNKCFELAIELKEKNKLIGFIGLIRKDHKQGEIGWALSVDYRGNGYATEAARALISYGFEKLDLHRIFADTSNINVPSWKMMERLGMRREGHYRESEFRDDQWIDVLVYAILADEWRAKDQK
jgi:RimJ/RimL family protein N-acetyltransferase